MGKPIALCFAHNVGWLFAVSEYFHAAQKKFPYGDDRFVADPEMFLATIEDRTHTLRGAGIMVEKVFDPREVDRFLHLSILQVIIARITNTEIIRADLLAPMNFIFLYRTSAAKTDVVTLAMGIVGRHVGMYFITIELVRRSPGGDATVNW